MKNAVCKMMTLLLVGVTTLSGLNYSTVYANETVNDKDPIIDDISIDKQGQTVKVYYSVGEYYNIPQDLFTVSVKAHDDQSIEKVDVKISSIVSISDDESLSSISRENQSRYMTVTATIDSDYNVGLVGKDVKAKLDNYKVKDYKIKERRKK